MITKKISILIFSLFVFSICSQAQNKNDLQEKMNEMEKKIEILQQNVEEIRFKTQLSFQQISYPRNLHPNSFSQFYLNQNFWTEALNTKFTDCFKKCRLIEEETKKICRRTMDDVNQIQNCEKRAEASARFCVTECTGLMSF